MRKLSKIIFLLVLLTACSGGTKKKSAGGDSTIPSKILFGTYCNERYDYCVDYPEFLIPQGESTSQDGQIFVSEDKGSQMMVFYEYKIDDWGNFIGLKEAYHSDREKTGSLSHEIYDNYYVLTYEKDKKLVRYISIEAYDAFVTIILEFDEKEKQLFEDVFQHVSESLHIAAAVNDEVNSRLMSFLADCWWDVNFNSMLLNRNEKLMAYVNKDLGIQRIHSPGTVPMLSGENDNYGFTEYDNFDYKPVSGEYFFDRLNENTNICAVDNPFSVYYSEDPELPQVIIHGDTFEFAQVTIPWDDAEIISVYVFNENCSPRVFYFALLRNDDFYLVLVDDSLCEA